MRARSLPQKLHKPTRGAPPARMSVALFFILTKFCGRALPAGKAGRTLCRRGRACLHRQSLRPPPSRLPSPRRCSGICASTSTPALGTLARGLFFSCGGPGWHMAASTRPPPGVPKGFVSSIGSVFIGQGACGCENVESLWLNPLAILSGCSDEVRQPERSFNTAAGSYPASRRRRRIRFRLAPGVRQRASSAWLCWQLRYVSSWHVRQR